jgi:uncharacterized protein (TIGR02757 family)
MGDDPYDFIKNHKESDKKRFLNFKHRTFQPADTLYFLHFLQKYYQENQSLEDLFAVGYNKNQEVRDSLIHFNKAFFDDNFAPHRTKKHISSPAKKSTCKRLNMFLRWMVRKDNKGVDFGIWQKISPKHLMIPLDVHVERQARNLGLLERKQRDWQTVEELTERLRQFSPEDPVRYDFALFGLGIERKKLII